VALLGRGSGIQLNLIIGAAAAFFILGLERLTLCVALITVCFLLHLAAWLLFPQGTIPTTPAFLDQLYISSAVTAFAITALLVYYAFRLAERAEAETEVLLRNILPDQIVDRLRQHPEEAIAEAFDAASILFSDIQGFCVAVEAAWCGAHGRDAQRDDAPLRRARGQIRDREDQNHW